MNLKCRNMVERESVVLRNRQHRPGYRLWMLWLLFMAGVVSPSFAQFTVVSVSPELHSTQAILNEAVRVTFSTDVDALTLNANSFRVYGHQSGQIPGTYSVDAANGMVGVFQPDRPYKPVSLSRLC